MKSSTATAFLWIVFGPFGVFCLAWAFLFLARAEYLSAVVALGAAAFALGLVTVLTVVASRNVTPRVLRDTGGIMVRPDRKIDALLMVSTFGGYVAMVFYAIFSPLGMLDIRAPRGNGQYLVFACAVGMVVGAFSLRQIITRRGMSYLRMTVNGMEIGNAMSSTDRPWDDVTDITDRPQNGRHPGGATYITTADGRTRTFPSDWYTPRGCGLRDFMRFYWRHPEKREELVDGGAITRLREGSGDSR